MVSVLILSQSCICAKWVPTSGPENLTQVCHMVFLRKIHFQFQTAKLEINFGEHILVIQGLSVPSLLRNANHRQGWYLSDLGNYTDTAVFKKRKWGVF